MQIWRKSCYNFSAGASPRPTINSDLLHSNKNLSLHFKKRYVRYNFLRHLLAGRGNGTVHGNHRKNARRKAKQKSQYDQNQQHFLSLLFRFTIACLRLIERNDGV